jgi:hypothetical protein
MARGSPPSLAGGQPSRRPCHALRKLGRRIAIRVRQLVLHEPGCTPETGLVETRTVEVGSFEMRAVETRALEIGAVEMRVLEFGPFEMRVLEVGAVEMRALEIGVVDNWLRVFRWG